MQTASSNGPVSHPRSVGRSVRAILFGVVAVIVLSLGTDALMHGTGVFPPLGKAMSDALFALATAYRIVYGIVGGYIAARFAPSRPMFHALILGLVGMVLSVIGAIATWNAGPEFGPKWYPLALVNTALPGAWIGGLLFERAGRVRAS
jgi:hypothetical protein